MSGYMEDEYLGASIRKVAAGYVPKPFTPTSILREVRRVLDS